MSANPLYWPQEKKDRALILWTTTIMTQREIAVELDVTYNMIVGIKTRNGWPKRLTWGNQHSSGGIIKFDGDRKARVYAKRKTTKEEKKARAEKIELNARLKLQKEADRQQAIQQAYEDSKPKLVHMFDIRDGQCRQIIGEPKGLTMCGNDCHKGSYCLHHYNANVVTTTFNASIVRSFVEKRA